MLSDYEEDDLFEGSINSSKLEEHAVNWSSISSRPSSLSKSSSLSVDEIENDAEMNMISNRKLTNTHLLKLLSDLVQTFFQVTHEIENCLNCYVINRQNLIVNKQLKLDHQTNECDHNDNGESNEIQSNHTNNYFNTDLSDSFSSDQLNTKAHLMNQSTQHQQVDEYDDEIVFENFIPHPTAKHMKINIAQSFQSKDNSMILKESSTVNKNSNYYEISCSYIVQLNNSKNFDNKNRIIEDKKPYISASINVNNCYKSNNKEQQIKSSLDSDDEAYSDATSDFSDSLESTSYSFALKNKPIHPTTNESIVNKVFVDSTQPDPIQSKQQPDIDELVEEKMQIFKQSLINLTQCEELLKCLPDDRELNDKFEIDKLGSNYVDFLVQEELVFKLCTRLKSLIQQLIQLIKSLTSDDLDNVLKDVLNHNAELSDQLRCIRQETQKIECTIKNVIKKESKLKIDTINHRHLVNEIKHNQERVDWLESRLHELKSEIDLMKEEQRLLEFDDSKFLNGRNQSTDDDEIFEDCLDSFDGNANKSDEQNEIALFDRVQFENVAKSIQLSSQQANLMNVIDGEKFQMNTMSNKLKSEIEQIALSNEELIREKQYQFEDYTQHLNCLKKLVNSNKKFLDEQNFDRDHEKDTFNTKLTRINLLIKEKDLNLIKCSEKCEFLKSDLEELMTEKDELQCKNYNQERKLIDVNAKQEEMKQQIDQLQNENNVSFYRQEQIRNRVEEYQNRLDSERLETEKLKFDSKLQLDPQFYETLENVLREINKFQMGEKIREHLKKRSIERKKESSKRKCFDLQKNFAKTSSNLNNLWNTSSLTPIKTSSSLPFSSIRSKSFVKSTSSTPSRTNSFSSTKLSAFRGTRGDEIKARPQSLKIPRSKSFMNDESITRNNRYSLKLNDESYSKFVLKLKNTDKHVLDDEDFYSFKECSSLISLNKDLMDDWSLRSDSKSDSLYSLESENLDEELNEIDENPNASYNSIDARRSLSEDTFYFSLMSEDANTDANLTDLYAELDRCKDAEKLKYYAFVISNFFKQITKSIHQCRDALQNTALDNKTKKMKLIELEKTYEQLKSMIKIESFNLERLQNELNNKHLEISELKNQIDSNQDNSLFIENKQILNELDKSMIENEENQFILQTNLEHLEGSLKKKEVELQDYSDQLSKLKKDLHKAVEQNQNLRIDNQNVEKENLKLFERLKKLREAKLYRRLRMLA